MRPPPHFRTRTRKTPPPRGGPGLPSLLGAAIVLSFLLFGASLPHGWLSDDRALVQDNLTLRQSDPVTALRIWGADYWEELGPSGETHRAGADDNLYRPVTILSFWINARLGAATPAGFRLTNLLLHALAAALIGALAARRVGGKAGWISMAVVAAHPAALDVINRLVGRADVLALVGMSGALLAQSAARGGWQRRHLVLLGLASVTAFGAKESGFALVPLALLAAWLDRERTPRPWLGPAVVAALAVVMIGLRLAVVGLPHYQPDVRMDLLSNPLAGLGLMDRLPAALANAAWYACMLVIPWPMKAIDRPLHLPGWTSPEAWLGGLVLGVMIGAFALAVRRRHEAALPLGWWLASYVIVGQLVLAIGAFRETRLLYPFLGAPALLVALAAVRLSAASVHRQVALLARGAALALAAVWVLLIARRTGAYADDRTLLEADLAHDPAPLTWLMLGTVYMEQGRMADAGAAKERALRLAPDSPQALSDAGAFFVDTNNFARGDSLLTRSMRLAPASSITLLNLGTLRLRQDRLAESHELLLRAEALDRDFILTQLNLALVEIRLSLHDSARGRLTRLDRQVPGDPRVMELRQVLSGAR